MKSEEETDENYGKRPSERSLEEQIKNSVIIVDKHSGPTSHQVTDWVKKLFHAKKAGHAGTLEN
ncbi:MAG: tRNA pseudouridine synthase A [Candidatus Aenigmatarchaeota archaeon]